VGCSLEARAHPHMCCDNVLSPFINREMAQKISIFFVSLKKNQQQSSANPRPSSPQGSLGGTGELLSLLGVPLLPHGPLALLCTWPTSFISIGAAWPLQSTKLRKKQGQG